MTSLDRLFVLVATLGFATPIATTHAALVAYDNFESYTAGADLDGDNGGTGWQGDWFAQPEVDVVSASLAYTGGSISVNGGSQAVRVNSTSDSLALRQFDQVAIGASSEVYFSFLFQENSGTSSDFINLWVSDTNNRNGSGGLGLQSTGSENFSTRIRATTGSDFTDLSSTAPVQGQTYFLVGRFSRDGTQGDPLDPLRFDLMELWINPTSLTLGTPDASVDQSSGINGGIQYFGIRTHGVAAPDQYLFDELRIGTSLAAVVPEPATAALLTGGLLVLALRRRRD